MRSLAPVVLALVAACSVDTSGELGTVRSAIIAGTDSPADQDAVVMIKHYDAVKIGGGSEGCTGTMLTPRLVLTARHCVAATDPQLACEADGTASFGGNVTESYPANKLFAFSGTARPDFISGLDRAARGIEIIDDAAKNLCNHDLALILLDKDLPGAKIAPIRLDAPPRAGEITTVVGWGVTDGDPSPDVRKQRTGVAIAAVGPGDSIGPAEFKVGESGCAGDSGGPAFAPSGAVLGVLSRGGNGKNPDPSSPALNCIGGNNVFTAVAGFRDLILSAYAKAGQNPWNEGAPDPRTVPKTETPSSGGDDDGGGCAIAARESNAIDGAIIAGGIALAACIRRRRTRSSAA